MTNAVAVRQETNIVSRFSPEQADLIKRTICKGATDDELRMFMYQAEKTGLDPLARQIYSIERKEQRNGQWVSVRSIQTSIDGFRLIANRTGEYEGQDEPLWCGEDGAWKDVWLSDKPPVAAKIGVWRKGFKKASIGVARFDAYAQKKDGKPTFMWGKMADVMLAKCAEALALRKAFPQELSGLYTSDEMEQATPVIEPAKIEPIKMQHTQAQPPAHPETGEVSPHVILVPLLANDAGADWMKWGASYAAALQSSTSVAELNDWIVRNAGAMQNALEGAPKIHARLKAIIEARTLALATKKAPPTDELEEALHIPQFLRRGDKLPEAAE